MHVEELSRLAVDALEDIKARDIVVLDVKRMNSLFDHVIVATADSARQTKSLAHHVQEKLKGLGATVIGVEGLETGEWVLVDLGDVVVHIMQPAIRDYYNLEELWGGQRPAFRPSTASARLADYPADEARV
ncbi:MAG: ribosome silencing factor [Burkholderiales bacterium]|nr:ribosome silencing factor [Burkholderiales bacterium]